MHEYMQAICGVDEVLGRLKDRSRVRDCDRFPRHTSQRPHTANKRGKWCGKGADQENTETHDDLIWPVEVCALFACCLDVKYEERVVRLLYRPRHFR